MFKTHAHLKETGGNTCCPKAEEVIHAVMYNRHTDVCTIN